MTGIPPIAAYPLPSADALPASVPSWRTDPSRALLLVHDMQSYFLAPFEPALRSRLLENVGLLRDRCDRLGVPVAYTAQPGGMSPRERGLLQDVWGPGMSEDERDRRIVPELTPTPGDEVFTKWRYSAFQRTSLLEHMHKLGRDQLIVCGVYAHIGVLATAVEAFSHDIETFLVADAVADFGSREHQMALGYAARCCAVVITAEEVLT